MSQLDNKYVIDSELIEHAADNYIFGKNVSYWLGNNKNFNSIKYTQPDEHLEDCEIIQSIKHHIQVTNPIFFNELKTQKYYISKTIAIDGTCCTGKTTLLTMCEDVGIKTAKINKHVSMKNINNNPLCGLMYLLTGIEFVKINPNVVLDRTIYNNLLWIKIWRTIINVATTERQSIKDCFEYLNADKLFDANTFDLIRRISPSIILINSDENAIRQKLIKRGTVTKNTNDVYRGEYLQCYIPAQNAAYVYKHKEMESSSVIINFADYGETNQTLVQRAIIEIIKDIFMNDNLLSIDPNEQAIEPRHMSHPQSDIDNKFTEVDCNVNLNLFKNYNKLFVKEVETYIGINDI